MNKILVGLIAGAVMGLIDGATAWFTPAVRPMIGAILIGSSVKGMIVGLFAGILARRVDSMWPVVGFAAGLGLLLAYIVASTPTEGKYYYFEIMTPGFITGALIGYISQRYGKPAQEAMQMAARQKG